MASYPGRGKARQVDQSDEEDVTMNSDSDSHLNSDPDPPPPPKGFCALPLEIREAILILACGLPRVHHRRDPGLSTQCTKTINRLSFTSRALYAQMMPILYENVRLTRPSDLRIFHTTIVARPALDQYVKRLHIGCVDPLSKDWWPMQTKTSPKQLRVSLVDQPLEQFGAPEWLCPTQAFNLEGDSATEIDKTVRQAIKDASRDLGVDLLDDYYMQSKYVIFGDWWHVRVLEVQAALELYLAEMGRRDDKQRAALKGAPWIAAKPSYPRVAIRARSVLSSHQQKGGKDVFWLSRLQLLEHMTRRRARADHFDHPVLFARSAMPWEARDSDDLLHCGEGGLLDDDDVQPGDTYDNVGFNEHLTLTQSRVVDVGDAGVVMPRPHLTDPLDSALPNIATIGGITALARSLLSFTPFVQDLSFTGFLERIMGGIRAPPLLSELRSLTLGPPPEAWRSSLRLNHATLATLERLRICGRELSEFEMAHVVGKQGALPNLASFQWSHLEGCEDYRMTLMETVGRLLDVEAAPQSAQVPTVGHTSKRLRQSTDEEEEDSYDSESLPSGSRARPLFIEARLHPADVKEILDAAPSEEVRQAWRTGAVLPNSKVGHRFKVVAGIEEEKWSSVVAMKVV